MCLHPWGRGCSEGDSPHPLQAGLGPCCIRTSMWSGQAPVMSDVALSGALINVCLWGRQIEKLSIISLR